MPQFYRIMRVSDPQTLVAPAAAPGDEDFMALQTSPDCWRAVASIMALGTVLVVLRLLVLWWFERMNEKQRVKPTTTTKPSETRKAEDGFEVAVFSDSKDGSGKGPNYTSLKTKKVVAAKDDAKLPPFTVSIYSAFTTGVGPRLH